MSDYFTMLALLLGVIPMLLSIAIILIDLVVALLGSGDF